MVPRAYVLVKVIMVSKSDSSYAAYRKKGFRFAWLRVEEELKKRKRGHRRDMIAVNKCL